VVDYLLMWMWMVLRIDEYVVLVIVLRLWLLMSCMSCVVSLGLVRRWLCGGFV